MNEERETKNVENIIQKEYAKQQFQKIDVK